MIDEERSVRPCVKLRSSKDLTRKLRETGVKFRELGSSTYIELLEIEENVFSLPSFFKEEEDIVFLNAVEAGGAPDYYSGSAQVVCGLSGKALKPAYIYRHGQRACCEHAEFSVPWGVTTISGFLPEYEVQVIEHRTQIKGKEVVLYSKINWKGEPDLAPKRVAGKYGGAIEAAIRKAHALGCRELYYADIPRHW